MFCLAVVPATLIAMPFQYAALGPAKTVAALPLLAAINACLVEFTLQAALHSDLRPQPHSRRHELRAVHYGVLNLRLRLRRNRRPTHPENHSPG